MTRVRRPTVEMVARLFHLFSIDIVARWCACQSGAEQIEAFKTAKVDAKAEHRRLALEHHPDRGGDAERLKEINAAWTQLDKIEMRAAPPAPKRKSALNVGEATGMHTSVFVGVVTSTGTSTSSATAGSAWDELMHIVRMRRM